ncbi:MAG: PilN domain-containing protein [Clostridium sp.]|uniref:PilN domain-containing protein n=1 Tax=Clostridium sp. TaxID=1506 RepID=UPI003F3D6282
MKKSINLNPKGLKREEKNKDIIILSSIIIVVAVILCIYTANEALKLHKIKNTEATIQTEVNNLDTGDLNSNLNSSLNEKNEKIKTLENSIKSFDSYKYLNGINEADVEGIEMKNVLFNKGIINIEGTTKEENLISVFMQNLKQNKLYKNVELNLINVTKGKDNSNEYNFTISLSGGNDEN